MPARKLERSDYVYCVTCEVSVAKSKLVTQKDFFTDASATVCPHCGGDKLESLDGDDSK
jgi:Zn finger protein HypA/HybF involved in hydrogenase expression